MKPKVDFALKEIMLDENDQPRTGQKRMEYWKAREKAVCDYNQMNEESHDRGLERGLE